MIRIISIYEYLQVIHLKYRVEKIVFYRLEKVVYLYIELLRKFQSYINA